MCRSNFDLEFIVQKGASELVKTYFSRVKDFKTMSESPGGERPPFWLFMKSVLTCMITSQVVKMTRSSIGMNSACTEEEAGLRLDAGLGWAEGLMSTQRQAKYVGPILVVDNAITAQTHHAHWPKRHENTRQYQSVLNIKQIYYILYPNILHYEKTVPLHHCFLLCADY